MKELRNYDEKLFMSNMFIAVIAIFNAVTGIFFIFIDNNDETPTYSKMAELMSLDSYGLIMLLSALFLIVSAFQMDRLKYLSMIVGGLLGAFVIGLYASASTIEASNLMVPIRYSLMACGCLIIATVGGVGLWKSRRDT